MMRRAALILLGTLGTSLASSQVGDRATTTPTTSPTTAPATATTNGFGPITYYEEYCSRCHGQFGTGYLPDMGKRLSDDALRRIIKDMAEGPAAAPLDDAQLEAELAYHRSFLDGTPFIARVSETDAEHTGEVTGGSALSVDVDGNAQPIPVNGQTWKLSMSTDPSPRLIAEREGNRTTLDPGKPFSHASRSR
jgi:hypothetical protein